MSDYGHDLKFGSFLTPTNDRPDQVVELAMLSEVVGLDLVTFQDHPYLPTFLDTWTLLSFVAARTSTISLAPNVVNLPLRPPAVLARAVASLDLLSHGRVELGLGAGAFWDAIEAMGGRRLAPAQAVQALAEAIDVIRELWDTGTRGGARLDGEFYRVAGAKRGPAPAHDIDIWVGAYKPRMLRLTGARADGWLPTLSYLKPGDLAAANAVIDDAALEAGRTPDAVRRLLNVSGEFLPTSRGLLEGPAEQWAEELADLRRFAAEVVPAVRELVDAERRATSIPGGSAAEVAASPVANAGRRPASAFAVVPTPDDGARRSNRPAWDESSRPDGPRPDPARTYTPHEQAAGQHLVDIHDALRAELAQLYDLVEQAAAGTIDPGRARSHINTMTLRQNKWTLGTYCESYCRIVTTHHTLEDRSMFPHLRRSDPRLAPVVDRLAEEHHVIHGLIEDVDRALVEFVASADGIPRLRAVLDVLSDALLSHLSYEERELVEPIARLGLW
jgi:alkanesulfonate monooxygenase SsuD/methylene tetrahydromethanopterin reductase-like flavin-dependent oxidoreductase (luciferase family)